MSDLHFIKIVDRITERLFKSAKNHGIILLWLSKNGVGLNGLDLNIWYELLQF